MDKSLKELFIQLNNIENKIKKRSLSDLCKDENIVSSLVRLGENLYSIQKELIEAAENAFNNNQEKEYAYKIFEELQSSEFHKIFMKSNYFLGYCSLSGFGCKKDNHLTLKIWENKELNIQQCLMAIFFATIGFIILAQELFQLNILFK
ncbi:3577_t:CDS:2, partial [Gigaspora margarita]